MKNGKNIQDVLPVEEKESCRWIKSLETTLTVSKKTQVITVCDRECDFYDFFKTAEKYGSAVLVRASQNRTVKRTSRYAEKDVIKLCAFHQHGEEAAGPRTDARRAAGPCNIIDADRPESADVLWSDQKGAGELVCTGVCGKNLRGQGCPGPDGDGDGGARCDLGQRLGCLSDRCASGGLHCYKPADQLR